MTYMRYVLIWLLFFVAVVLQTTVSKWISIGDIGPDLLLIFIVYRAFRRGPAVGAAWGFLVGFATDIYGPVEWLGANTVVLTILGFIVGQLEERFLTLKLGLRLFALAFGFLLGDLIFMWMIGVSGSEVGRLFLFKSLPECIYTTIIGGVIYYFAFRKQRYHTDHV